MSLLTVLETKSISLRGFWDTTRQLKLFVWVNIALVLSCIAAFFSLPTAGIALLYLSAGILSVWAGVLKPVEGLACYFSLSFYTALPVVITGSPFSSSVKDVLLVIAVFIYLLTIKYRTKGLGQTNPNSGQYKPLVKKQLNQLSISTSLLVLFIVLAVIVLSLLFFRYQNITLLLLGLRGYFFYLLVAVIAYKKLAIHLIPLFMQAIILAALWPSLVGILQLMQIIWSPAWLPSLTLFSEDDAGELFQGSGGVGIIQETVELIRTPATLTGVPQFACLNIITGIALITLISLVLKSTINNVKVTPNQWFFLTLLSVFFFISTLAGGNRMPIAILLVIGTLSFFTIIAMPKRKPKLFQSIPLKKRKINKIVVVTSFIVPAIFIIVAISIYVINLLPEVYTRYIGSIGYQISVRVEVLATQIEPIFQFPLIDQFLGVGPGTQSAGSRYLNGLNASRVGGNLHAESQLLQQTVELGMVFFPIYFLPRIIIVFLCLKKLLLQRKQLYSGYLLPLAVTFGVMTIVPYGNFITLDPMNAFYWLVGGLLLKFVCTKNQTSRMV